MSLESDLRRQDDFTRRQFISGAARTYLGVTLLPLVYRSLASPGWGAPGTKVPGGKAEHVIFLNMNGGMSHLDTFDPKPRRSEVQGPVKVLDSKAPGIQISEYLPQTATVMDKVCVINSMTSTNGAHERGQYVMHTSYAPLGTIVHPAIGSWVVRLADRRNPNLPGFVTIGTGPEVGSGGWMGAKYSAVPVLDPEQGLVNSKRQAAVSKREFRDRLVMADELNKRFHKQYRHDDVKGYEDLYAEATRLMTSEDLAAFNLSKEKEATREAYGKSRFGQGCLLARRLVEKGVRFVEVTLGGWDTHYDNFTAVKARCDDFDRAYASLLKELSDHNLLDSTLVVVGTEFGRTPTIQEEHNNGRDHHPSAFTCLMAGGGVIGGEKYGETDTRGERVKDKPVTLEDFNATIAYALRLPHEEVHMSPGGRPFTMANKGKPVTEIFG
jgi:hypothetical protein